MSYILEALKKSKQERQGGGTPHLHTVHAPPSFKTHSSKKGRSGLLACGLLIVLGLVGLVYNFLSTNPSVKIEDSSHSVTVRAIEIRPHFFEQAEETSIVVQDSGFIPAKLTRLEESLQPVKIATDKFKKVVTKTEKNVEPPPSEDTYGFPYRVQLSPEIQKEIPQFNFAGHTYADDPKRRMIIINNQILREGDSVDSDTTLVNIVWEGVVLKYKGITFRQKNN